MSESSWNFRTVFTKKLSKLNRSDRRRLDTMTGQNDDRNIRDKSSGFIEVEIKNEGEIYTLVNFDINKTQQSGIRSTTH